MARSAETPSGADLPECANLGDDPAVEGLIAVDPERLNAEQLGLLLDSGAGLLLHTNVAGASAPTTGSTE